MTPNLFNESNKSIEIKKAELNSAFQALLSEITSNSLTRNTYNSAHSSLSSFTTEFELFITNISSREYHLSETQIHDALTSIESVLLFIPEAWIAIRTSASHLGIPPATPSTNYLFTSQAILKSYKKDKAEKIKKLFIENNLPTDGFMQKNKMKLNELAFDKPQTIAGIILLLVGLVIVFAVGLETGMQYYITRILISLGAGLLISGLGKSHIHTEFRFKGTIITAVGAAGVFFVLYFINPADAPTYNPTPPSEATK